MHCSGVILAHSSTVFKSWRFCGSLLWSLIFSSYFQLDSSQVYIGIKSGDWLAIQAALFYFSETNWEFVWLCLGSLFVKCPPLFHLHHPVLQVLGLNQLILISTDETQDCFLFTDRFLLVSWLYMPFCTSLSSFVQYLSPVSFHFIMHNLISELIYFYFFVCIDYFGCYQHLMNISSQHYL